MKRLIVAATLALAFAASAFAADIVVFPAKNGNVTFNHKVHSAKFACKICHGEGAPSKIAIDKDKAHTLCKECHQKAKSDKVAGKCAECHKK